MKISQANVNLSGDRVYSKKTTVSENLEVWGGSNNKISVIASNDFKNEKLELSEDFKNYKKNTCKNDDNNKEFITISDLDKQKIDLIERFCNRVLGKNLKFDIAEKIEIKSSDINLYSLDKTTNSNDRQGWGFSFSRIENSMEIEKTSFNASAEITTHDGRQISIDLNLLMSRQFESQSVLSIKGGEALKDPLILNFGTPTAEVTQKKYKFDIDCDDVMDSISFACNGSGFLALDKNKDGIINDGNELFGTKSGDGFYDLSYYDEDKNGWIDENDSIFYSLRVWTKDSNGNDYLFALAEKEIGAIYLGSANTEFSINNSQNETNAVIRKTGIFLFENAESGTIQHIDLVV